MNKVVNLNIDSLLHLLGFIINIKLNLTHLNKTWQCVEKKIFLLLKFKSLYKALGKVTNLELQQSS
jgi:hypothetical protein